MSVLPQGEPRPPRPRLIDVLRVWFDPSTARGLILIGVAIIVGGWFCTEVVAEHLVVRWE